MERAADNQDGASDLADANFDGRVAMRKDAFLKPGRRDEAAKGNSALNSTGSYFLRELASELFSFVDPLAPDGAEAGAVGGSIQCRGAVG